MMETELKKGNYPWQVLSGNGLKWIALLTMVIDHTAMVLVSQTAFPELYILMRSIGRLAFPIYCFLLVEGFYHTHSFRNYAVSLGLFAVISEIPYDLAKNAALSASRQNVFFTLLLGLFMIRLMQEKKENPAWRLIFLMGFGGIAQLLHMDYGMFGMMQIASIYFCYHIHIARYSIVVLLNFLQGGLQTFGAAAVLPMACYNGTRGRQWKYFFYAAYPVHLLLLFFIRSRYGIFDGT